MLLYFVAFSFSYVSASRVQPQSHLEQSSSPAVKTVQIINGTSGEFSADVAGPKASHSCRQGMHIPVDRSFLDKHVVNPETNDSEEQHFVLTKELAAGESQRGWCKELIQGPQLFDSKSELWDPEDSQASYWLFGTIEVGCEVDGKKPSLNILQFSCRELLPFATIWEHDSATQAQKPDDVVAAPPSYEFAEFTCSNPLEASTNLLHSGPSKVLKVVSGLREAQAACEADPQCEAIATDFESETQSRKGGKKDKKNSPSSHPLWTPASGHFHLLDSFNCMPTDEAFHSTFAHGETVELRYLAHTQGFEESTGTVLETWSLESGEVDVLVQFDHGTQHVLAEHLMKEEEYASSWAVLRKIREKKATCDDLTEQYSCDIYSKASAKMLDAGTPASCHEACLSKTEAAHHLNRCCVFADNVCALTTGELFHIEVEEDRPAKPEWAGLCYQEPCSLDPMCAFGKGELPNTTSSTDAATVFFDFAHPLTLPFSIDKATGLIYHFTSEDDGLEAARKDKKRLVRPVGQVADRKPKRRHFAKLPDGLRKSGKKAINKFQQELESTCEDFGQSIGRRLLAPNLQEALASDECHQHRTPHTLETCLVKAGCHAQSKKDADHPDWLPFSPLEFAQLPYDLLAWQTPAAFCCSTAYTADERQEHLIKSLLEKADVKGVSLDQIDDAMVRKNLKKSVKSGSSALKKMLMNHVSDEAELNWLGETIRLALAELKVMLTDLQETVNSENSEDVEIADDASAILQVAEDGDQVLPSGRRGFAIAEWSQEKGAFLQTNPKNTSALRKAWNLISRVPGAVYQYGVRPLWNFVAKPLMKWGVSLMKWILEHPRAALFVSKFAVIIKDRLCEKASFFAYGDPGTSAVGAFAYAANSAKELNQYVRKTFSPAVVLTGLKEIMSSSPLMNTIAETGQFSFSLMLSWAGFAAGGPAVALLGTLSSLLAQAGLEAGRRAMELMIYQEIAKEIPSNLFDMLTSKCLFKREARKQATWNSTQAELVTAGKEAITKVTETVQSAGQTLSEQMSRWSNFFSSVKK